MDRLESNVKRQIPLGGNILLAATICAILVALSAQAQVQWAKRIASTTSFPGGGHLRSRKAIVTVHPSAYARSRVTITIWKDMFTKRPGEGQPVLARRTIWETAPIFGYWNAEGDCLVCGTGGWTLKDFELWKWRAVKGALPPWPVPHYVKAWSDVWDHPPADKEPGWS